MRSTTVICAVFLLLVHSGCGRRRDATGPSTEVEGGLRIIWVRPTPFDSIIADTIRIELSLVGDDDGGILVMAEDSTLCRLARPPWRLEWLPSGIARTIRLRAVADGVMAPDRPVSWSPDSAPSVEIIGLSRSGGIVRAPGESLRAVVLDPEDGRLAGDAICWTSDVQGVIGFGEKIPSESLVPGCHRIRVRGTDRWGKSTTLERGIETFDAGDATSPERLIDMIRCAMLTVTPEAYRRGFTDEFRFFLCPAEREADPTLPVGWGYETEAAFSACLQIITRAELPIASVEATTIGEEGFGKVEIDQAVIDLDSGSNQLLNIRHGRARVFLHRAAGSSEWKVFQWNDLGAEGLSYARARLISRHTGRD